MEIRYNKTINNLTVYFNGELDECSSLGAKKDLDRLFDNNVSVKKVTFDLTGLTFMDSTGIGLLIGRYKKLSRFNIPIFLKGANCQIEKILDLSGLYSIMPKI